MFSQIKHDPAQMRVGNPPGQRCHLQSSAVIRMSVSFSVARQVRPSRADAKLVCVSPSTRQREGECVLPSFSAALVDVMHSDRVSWGLEMEGIQNWQACKNNGYTEMKHLPQIL